MDRFGLGMAARTQVSFRSVMMAMAGPDSHSRQTQAAAQLKRRKPLVGAPPKTSLAPRQADLVNCAGAHTPDARACTWRQPAQAAQCQRPVEAAQCGAALAIPKYSTSERRRHGTVRPRRRSRESGPAIAIITDLNDTWVRAAIPETEAVHIALGDQLRVRLPSGDIVAAKLFSRRRKLISRPNAT